MEAVLLSKRKPYVEQLFCYKEKKDIYEEKRFQYLQKNLQL